MPYLSCSAIDKVIEPTAGARLGLQPRVGRARMSGYDFDRAGQALLVRACRGVLGEGVVENHISQLGLLVPLPLLHPPAAVTTEV